MITFFAVNIFDKTNCLVYSNLHNKAAFIIINKLDYVNCCKILPTFSLVNEKTRRRAN